MIYRVFPRNVKATLPDSKPEQGRKSRKYTKTDRGYRSRDTLGQPCVAWTQGAMRVGAGTNFRRLYEIS
jgi:hypothetical protein